nr:MAG TPA: cysteine synthase A [Caudoviricetes sp.]
MLYENITEVIGNTPLIKLHPYGDNMADVYVKLESINPGGSVKDRIALMMIQQARKIGQLKEGQAIVEPTSGNTGIGLAMVGAALGHPVTIVMPESFSMERRQIIRAYGANLVLTPASEGMKGAIAEAKAIANIADAFMPMQFENYWNPTAHFDNTAFEIIDELTKNGKSPDGFVAGVGTGGTITGAGHSLKEEFPSIKIVAVESAESPVLSGGEPGPHKIQGISAGFIPQILDTDIIDEIKQVPSDLAINTARTVAVNEGVLVGISSGAAISAAFDMAEELGSGKTIVVIAPDTGERYLSTVLFEDYKY